MVDFRPEEEVEVGNSGRGWKGSWYAAIVLQKSDRPSRSASKTSKKLFVEYQTLKADKQGVKPLRENVNLCRVRPKPPTQNEADRSFHVDEKVEVFDNDGWWEGTVSKVLENQRYSVYFKESDEEIEYEKTKLRRHLEWIDERWVCEAIAQEQQTMVLMLSKGDSVEVRVDGEICSDAWFPATVLQQMSNNRFLVELQSSHVNTFQLLETVDAQHIRPIPPQMSHVNTFQLSEKVDALYDWRWWSGIINEVLSGGRYIVSFEHLSKPKEFVHSELRFHMDWVDGKWYRDSKEISVTPHVEGQTGSPGHVQSGQAGNTNQSIFLASELSLDDAENAATENTPGKFQSRQDEYTFQNTDLTCPLSLDATKNVAAKSLSIQAQTEQDRKTFQSTDMAHQSSGNAVKHVVSKKSHSPRISKRLDYQLSSKKAGSPGKAHSVDTAKEIGSEKSPTCLSGEALKAQMSLVACPILRGISTGTFNSGQDQRKHDLESNRPKSLPFVEGCSSHLQLNSGQDQDADSSKIQTMARQVELEIQTLRQKRKPLGGDDIEQHEMERVSKQKMNASDRRRQTREKVSSTKASMKGGERQAGKYQAHDARIETQTAGPEHTAANRETSTIVVQAEENTLKEIEMDEGSNDNRDSDQHISMCIEECYFPSSIDENGVSSANQPMVQAFESIIWEDAPMRGPELQNPLNVIDNSYSLVGITFPNQAYEAIGDECDMQFYLIDDDIPLEDEGLPFVKCSPLWETVESTEAFRAIPQQSHFRPLKQFPMDLREGLAIGLTLSFIGIVEKVGKAKVDDPLIVLQDRSKALEHLKANGFNVQPIQARLEELLRIKEKQERLNSRLVEAEEQINEKQHEKAMLETEFQEVYTEISKMEERLNELKKKGNWIQMKNENQSSKIDELKTTVNTIREWIQSAELKFNSVAAAPW